MNLLVSLTICLASPIVLLGWNMPGTQGKEQPFMPTIPNTGFPDRRDLGAGLIGRWSTIDDTENIAQLCGKVFRDAEEEPFNSRMIDNVYRQMRGGFPLMGPGDYALIEDTRTE